VARFDPTPVPGYDPILRINLRERAEGGPPLSEVQAGWKHRNALPQRELLVLIHGYNNHRQEAESAYAGLRKRQVARLSERSGHTVFEERLGDVFWPGDAEWAGVVDKLDFTFYSKAVSVAKDVAPRIAAYLRTRTDVLTVHFLAHSLGCRVALEIIDDIARGGGPAVGKVCFLAAAVPTFKVCPGPRGSLVCAVDKAGELLVLFSPDDIVLSAAFRGGQTIASGDEGFFPVAVGHAGDIPLTPGKVDRVHIKRAGHSHYWGHESGDPSDLSATAIFKFFRFDGLGARTLSERPLTTSRPDLPSRRIADRN